MQFSSFKKKHDSFIFHPIFPHFSIFGGNLFSRDRIVTFLRTLLFSTETREKRDLCVISRFLLLSGEKKLLCWSLKICKVAIPKPAELKFWLEPLRGNREEKLTGRFRTLQRFGGRESELLKERNDGAPPCPCETRGLCTGFVLTFLRHIPPALTFNNAETKQPVKHKNNRRNTDR